MTRVSPPELARELPGPHASISVTAWPRRSRSSAVNPPNAPAPTTIAVRRFPFRAGGFAGAAAIAAVAPIPASNARRESEPVLLDIVDGTRRAYQRLRTRNL